MPFFAASFLPTAPNASTASVSIADRRLARSTGIGRLLAGMILLLLLAPAAPVLAYEGPIDNGGLRDMQPALGINDTFGRWDTSVKLVYDPDSVPAAFSNNTKMLALIREAALQWEQVSGIRFEVVGTDRNAPDDSALNTNQQDGFVRIFWAQTNGFAGLAGPDFGSYSQDRGYFPYFDGSVKLNQDAASWDSDAELVNTLVHEFGHLIGLGHSENPLSIMYANPYNNLNYPRQDDIRAVQALYGAGTSTVDPAAGVSAWRYTVPPAAPASVTQFLFKPNEFTSASAFLSLESIASAVLTTITAGTPDEQFVRLNPGGLGGFTNPTAINIAATVVIVDPDGYVWDKTSWQLTCAARVACGGGFISSITTDPLKSYPGTWKFLVVDEAANTLLLTKTLTVTTTPEVNSAPIASFTAVAGDTSTKVRFTIAATDSEKQHITAIWHPPGSFDRDGDRIIDTDITEPVGIDGVATQTIDFSLAGTYTLFVELRDNGARYNGSRAGSSSAGDGFSNLLRFTVTLPLNGVNGGVTLFAQHATPTTGGSGGSTGGTGGTSTTSTQTLQAIAGAQVFSSISTSGTTTAAFNMGASKDSGVTKGTSFKPGDSIIAAGSVIPQLADINKSADIYVVVRIGNDTWLYRDSSGAFRPWNRFVTDLKPAMTTTSLQSGTAVEVYMGPVGTGIFNVFLGYKLTGGSVLHYTPVPMQLIVN